MNAISGQSQTLTIGQGGVATGGYVNLTPQLAQTITGLVVPTNVSLLHNVSDIQTLNLAGNLTNSGNYFAFSTNNAITNGIINASNLYNNQNALITSVLPTGGLPGGITGAISNLSLTLNIVNNLFNAGAITSAGNLNINAGAIYNQLPAGVTGASPIMQAVNNLNLNATLGNITNSGAMAAVMGNVNLASVNNMVINNVNGSIQALMGNINVRDAAFDAAKNLDILGGRFVSQQLNLNSGKGDVNVDIIGATGLINVDACNLHIQSVDTINLGTLNLSGDPGVYSSFGDINIGGSIMTGGAPLALVASGSIRTTVAGLTINTDGVSGGNLFISAGGRVRQTATDGATVTDQDSFRRLGGNIDFATNALGAPLSATGTTGNGGNITLITLGGEINAGTIAVSSSISADSSAGGNAGNILILADAQPNNVNSYSSIHLGGNVTATGATGGSISIATAKPALSSTDPSVLNPGIAIVMDQLSASTVSRGAIRNMALIINGSVNSSGNVGGNIDIQAGTQASIAGNLLSSGTNGNAGNIALSTNSNVTLTLGNGGSSTNSAGSLVAQSLTGGNGGQINVTNAGTGGVTLTLGGNANAAGFGTSNGGSVTLSAPTGALTVLNTGQVFAVDSQNANGGNISLIAQRIVNPTAGSWTLSAPGGANGGTVTITQTLDGEALTIGNGAGQVSAQVGGGTGNGGSVTAASAGNLTVNPAGLLAINGSLNGSNLSFSTTGSNPLANLLVTGGLVVSGKGAGNGGAITLQSVAASNFLIGGAVANGVQGTLTSNGGATGNGGSVTATSARGLVVSTNISAAGGGTSGNGGTIALTASGSTAGAFGLSIDNTSLLNVSSTNGNAGTMTLASTTAPFQLVTPGTFNLNAAGTGNGGTFSLTAHSIVGNLAVSANAATTGNGGAVSVTTTSNFFNLTAGNAGDSVTSIVANGIGATGNAGRVALVSAVDLTATMAGITANTGTDGNGAILTFTAGTAANSGGNGNLRVVGPIVANAGGVGTGGQVSLTSNSNLPFIFNLGLGGQNGITGGSISTKGGTTSGAAGTITINNQGSGGMIVAPANLIQTVVDGGGGALTLTAANGAVTLGAGTYDLSAVSAATPTQGGRFTASARDIDMPGGLVNIVANGAAAGGGGGSISITETGDVATATFSIVGGTLTLNANAGGGTGGAGGSITVSVPRALNVVPLAIGVAPAVNGAGGRLSFTAGTAVRSTLTVAGDLNVDGANAGGGTITLSSTGNLDVQGKLSALGTGTGAGGAISLTANGDTPFVVNGAGANRVAGTIDASSVGGAGGRLTIINPSGITIGDLNSINLSAGAGAGGTLTLTATNGPISIDATMKNTINLNGVGSSGGQFNLTAQSFKITGGTVQLQGQGTGGGGGVFNITSTAANADLSVQATGQFTILGGGVVIPPQTVQNALPIPAGTTVLTLPATTGFAAGQNVTVTQGTLTETVQIVSVDSPTQITVTPLTNAFPAAMPQPVVAIVLDSTGVVTLNSGRDLTVNMADVQVQSGANGPGASYTFNAGTSGAIGNLNVIGTINAAGVGGANPNQPGGAVTVTSNGTTRIQGDIITTGTGTAASGGVTIRSNSNAIFTVDPTAALATNGVIGVINTSSAGNIAGNVSITNLGVGGINIRNANTDLVMTSGGGSGASFTAAAGLGVFSVQQTSTINVDGQGGLTPAAGGTVNITAGSIETVGHLSISARGLTGSGGTVTLNATGASSFIEVSSNLSDGTFNITTDASVGNGGVINLTAGTRLLIDPAGVSNKTGDGGTGRNMTFTATGQAGGCCGSVLFTGPVNFSGQTTGVVINVNSVTPFTIGSPGTSGNGIVMDGAFVAVNMDGTGGGSGGNFSINQSGVGGVVISNGAIITARAGAGNSPFAGGSVSISTGSGGLTFGNGTIDVGVPSTAIPPVVPTIIMGIPDPVINGGTGSPQANGGSINISTNRLTVNAGATGPLNLLAQGGVSGEGGVVTVALTDAATALNIGSLAGQFNVDARGGAVGGRITLSSGQNLNVTAANALFGSFSPAGNFDGGRVSLTATGNVFWNGNLNAAGQNIGDGGQVTVRHGGFGSFYINAGNFGSGINGTLSVASGVLAGNGGLIDIGTTGFAGILINGGFTFNANATAVTTYGTSAELALAGGIAAGAGATSGTMNGGTVNINTNGITVLTAGNTTMTANGAGSGNGGAVTFNHRLLAIQAGGAGNNFNFTATGGSAGSTRGNGGSITLTSNSNLNIQTVGGVTFNAGPLGATGNGATYVLTSGSFGQVVVNGNLSANGVAAPGMFGDGGTIRITQPGSALFGIGTGSVGFGVNGNITADGAFGSDGKGGTIVISLPTSTVQFTGGFPIVSARGGGIGSTGVNSDGGTITFTANVVNPSATGNALIRANGGQRSNGGTISFTSTLSPISVGVAPNTIWFLAGAGSPGLNGNSNGGSLNLTAPSLNIDPNGIVIGPTGNRGNGGTMVLTATNGALAVSGSLSANAGTLAGNGGRIDLIGSSGAAFQYNNGAAPFNGINGNASAAAGSIAGNGGTILVRNTLAVGITVGAAATFNVLNASLVGQTAGSITLDAGNGALTINAPTISTTPTVGGGGIINLTGSSVTGPAGVALLLASNGGTAGDGGTVTVRTNQGNSNVGNLTIGSLAGNITVQARGGTAVNGATNGGTIDLNSAGFQFNVDPNAVVLGTQALNGNAGTLRLTAGGNAASPTANLVVSSSIGLNGIGRGNGGAVVIRAKGVNNFTLNGNTVNGVNGIISVNGGVLGGNAGTIDIEQSSINAGGGIVFNSLSPLTAAATRGNAGSIRVVAQGLLPIQFVGATSIDVSAAFQNRNGGTIELGAARYVVPSNVALTANAAGTGNGGLVTLRGTGVSGSASDITMGLLAGQFQINARGGTAGIAGGNGGTANVSVVSASNNLIIDPTGLNLGPLGGVGNGGTLTASAGLNLFVSGSLNLNSAGLGGNGGSATLTSGSNFPAFGIFAGATTNGINGTLTANALGTVGNGGVLSVTSTTAAGIALGAAQTVQVNAGSFDGTGGNVTFTATTNGTVNLGTNAVPVSVDGTGTKNGGTLTINTSILTVNPAANQTLQSRGGVLGGRGGTIAITVTSLGSPLNVGATAGTLGLAVNSNGVGGGGTTTLSSAAAMNLNSAGLFLLGAAGNSVGATLNATSATNGGFGNLTTIGSLNVGYGTGGLLNLRTAQAGTTILQTGLGALYSGRAIQLVTPGSLGSALAPIQTAASVDPSGGLQVQSTGAGSSAFVNQTGALALGTSTAGFQLNVTSNTEINVVGAISGANLSQINLTTTAALPGNGAINIRADVGGSSFATANINANGTGAITNTAGVVRVGTLNLTSGSGNIGTRASRVITTATSISANTSGNVFLFAAASPSTPGGFAPTVNVGTSSASAGIFDYLACGSINFVGNLNTPTLFLGTFSGDINASGAVLNTVGSIGITSANNATISKGAGPLTLLRSDVTNSLSVTTQGVLTINGPVTGNNLTFASNGVGGGIVINGNITGTNPTPTINSQVTFQSFSGNSLTRAGGDVVANTVNFSMGSGAVGTNFSRINTNANFINTSGFGATNNVFINELNGVTVGTFGFVSAGGTFDLTVQDGQTTFQSINAGGLISIVKFLDAGSLTQLAGGFTSNLGGGITLTTVGASPIILNGFISAGGIGNVSITGVGAGASVSLGNVSANNGTLSVVSVASGITQTAFTNISTNNGSISFTGVGGNVLLNGSVRTNSSGSISITSVPGSVVTNSLSTGFTGPNGITITGLGAGGVTINPNAFVTAGANGALTISAPSGPITLTNANLSSSGTGNLAVSGSGTIALGTLSSGSGTLNVTSFGAGGSIVGSGFFSGISSSSGAITISQVGGGVGGINLTGDVSTLTTGNINITAIGDAGATVRNVRTGFTGPNNNISIFAPAGVGAPVTQAAFTTISTGTGGTVSLTAQGLVSLQNITSSGAVNVTSISGGITQAASTNVSGSAVSYTAANAALGNITTNGMVRSNAGTLTIVAGNNLAVNSSITSMGGTLSLTANSGTFVSNTSGFLNASGGNLLVQTNNGASGNITLGASATVNFDGTGVRTLTVQSARSATVGSLFNFDPTGATSVSATTGVLQMNAFVSVQGDLSIINTGGGDPGDAVIISPFVSLFALAPSAPQGNITIALTNGAGVANIVGVPPLGGTTSQTTSGGGQIFFGPNQFQNTGFTTLNAKGANITFFNNKAAGVISSGIQTNSNFIFADPPVGGSSMTVPSIAPVPTPSSLPAAMALPMMTQPASTPAPAASTSGNNSATQLQMPAQVQGLVNIFRPFFVSPTPATATPVDTAPMQNVPVSTSTADVITQVRDAGGAMVQSAVANVNSVLTGFVTKKSGAIGGASSYMRPSHQAVVNQLDDSTFELKHGEVIVSANRRATVTSGEHTVDAAPGSIVHVTREGDVLKVRNLCDSVGKAVRVLVAGKSMPVNVGEEVVIGVSDGAVNSAIKGDNIGRRKVTRFVVDGRHSIVKSELSVIALIQKSNLLSSMYTKGSAADRNVMERIMKMAAALFQVTGKRGAYSAYDPSKVDAPVPLSSAAGDETVKVAQSR